MVKHLVANLVSALSNLDIYNFPHHIGEGVKRFAGPNPQPGLISFAANGSLSTLFDRGIDKSASRIKHQ